MHSKLFKKVKLTPYVLLATAISQALPAVSQELRLEEIVVTAQRRAQSMQDVPIAVTALTREMMDVNRVLNLSQLSSLAPNLTVRQTAGGTSSVSMSMRGITTYGNLPGVDRQISNYLDGVYLGSPRGTLFSLPDIEQIEVLRGPQGTLFGRNATAGAINLTTRNPSGEFKLVQELSFGNQDYLRSRTSLDLPAVGAFSVAGTYVTEEREGDIRNAGAGTTWDRTQIGGGIDRSPKTLGDRDSETVFLAAMYEPSDTFRLSYKFDYNTEQGTPHASVPLGVFPSPLALGPEGAAFFQAILAANPGVPMFPNARRPSVVNNAFHTHLDLEQQGHNITLDWELNQDLSLKSITAYRESEAAMVGTNIDGLGGMTLGFLGPVFGLPESTPICIICSHPRHEMDQFSSELQLHYQSDALTLTTGALYYKDDGNVGSDLIDETLPAFLPIPGNTIYPSGGGYFENETESMAAYVQAELHLSSQLDVIAGYRLTRDEKESTYYAGHRGNQAIFDSTFKETNPSYLIGVNYRPTEDMMLYAKYSTAFVSGGSIAGLAFEREDAQSWEAGVKASFMEDRLRANLAWFDVTYEELQTAQAGLSVGRPEVSTLIAGLGGDSKAQGVELELTALPTEGLTLNLTTGYTGVKYTSVSDTLLASVGGHFIPGSSYVPTLNPRWTSSLTASYETAPLWNDSHMLFTVSGNWRSKLRVDSNPARSDAIPLYAVMEHSPAHWVINARAALRRINLGPAEGEVAIWGHNLTDADYHNYALTLGSFTAALNFPEGRSYGVDFIVRF